MLELKSSRWLSRITIRVSIRVMRKFFSIWLLLESYLEVYFHGPLKMEWWARKWPNNLCLIYAIWAICAWWFQNLCLYLSLAISLSVLGGWRNVYPPPKSSWDLKIRYIICTICASRYQNLCLQYQIEAWGGGWRNGSPKSLCKFQNMLNNLCYLCPLPSVATSESILGDW